MTTQFNTEHLLPPEANVPQFVRVLSISHPAPAVVTFEVASRHAAASLNGWALVARRLIFRGCQGYGWRRSAPLREAFAWNPRPPAVERGGLHQYVLAEQAGTYEIQASACESEALEASQFYAARAAYARLVGCEEQSLFLPVSLRFAGRC
jgi:hypothetical protein